jgi:hypothetical protein
VAAGPRSRSTTATVPSMLASPPSARLTSEATAIGATSAATTAEG